MRHKLYLGDYTQVGKNRIALPKALADYYGNTAQAYVGGRQVESKNFNRNIEQAFNFVGDNGYINCGNPVYDISTSYSLECLFKTTTGGSLITRDSGTERVWQFKTYSCITIVYFGSSGIKILNGSTNCSDGNWHHAVATFSTTNGTRIYVDGELDASDSSVTGNSNVTGDNIYIGNGFNLTMDYVGDIAYAKIYDKELSSSEVSNRYNGIYISSGLVGEWLPENLSGSTVTDSAGSNNGTASNVTVEDVDYYKSELTFTTPTPTREIEVGRGNLELASAKPDTENRNVLSFDGTNDYAVSDTTLNFNGSYGEMEICFWYNTDSSTILAELSENYNLNLGCFLVSLNDFAPNTGAFSIVCDIEPTYNIKYFPVTKNAWNILKLKFNFQNYGLLSVTNMITGKDIVLTQVPDYNHNPARNIAEKYFYVASRAGSSYFAPIKVERLIVSDGTNTLFALEGYDTNNATVYGATETTDDVPIPIKTPSVLHWEPSSEVGYYWVLTEDASGNTVYLKHEGTWVEGQLFIKVDGSWKQASDVNIKTSGEWR